jgi:hypothetical protein
MRVRELDMFKLSGGWKMWAQLVEEVGDPLPLRWQCPPRVAETQTDRD